jgi:hypothetical protein
VFERERERETKTEKETQRTGELRKRQRTIHLQREIDNQIYGYIETWYTTESEIENTSIIMSVRFSENEKR